MKTIILCCAAALIAACSSPVSPVKKQNSATVATTASVIQPIEGLEIAPRIYHVSADQPSAIALPNGGVVRFPEHAFVDGSGNEVKGDVTIEWTEYHSLTDIMASGIPMNYDSAGVTNHFVSGGMFTIDGSQNGRSVEIAPGKNVDVKLGTYDEQKQYNFYQLDEQTGNWSYRLTATSTPNPKMKAQEAAVEYRPGNRKSTEVLAMTVVVNPDSFPELKKEKIVAWEWNTEGETTLQREVLMAGSVRTKIKNRSGKNYTIQVSSGKKTAEISAWPVFLSDAKDRTAAVEQSTGNDLASLIAFQRNNEQAIAFRSASIPGFGTYNWDVIHRREDPVQFALHLNISDKKNEPITAIYHVCPEEKALVRYSESDLVHFNYSPDKKNCLIVVYADKDVYAVDDKGFRAAASHRGEREFTFQPRKQGFRMSSPNQLGQIVERSI